MAPPRLTPAASAAANAERQIAVKRLLLEGASHQARGAFPEAEACYRAALRTDPRHAEAHDHLGGLALSAGREDIALRHLEAAVKLAPQSDRHRINLAVAYLRTGHEPRAISLLRPILTKASAPIEAHLNAVAAMRAEGLVADALAVATAMAKRFPDRVEAPLTEADILAELGDRDRAEASYRAALAIDPKCAEALAGLAHLDRLAPPEVADATALAGDESTPRSGRVVMLYALGNRADRAGHYRVAFAHFREAKRLDGLHFDADGYDRYVDRLRTLFTASFFAERGGFGEASDKPVFVIGLPRSGTSLVEQMLASHPLIHGGGEMRLTEWVHRELVGSAPLEAAYAALTRPASKRLAFRYLSDATRRAAGAQRIVDKKPQNFEMLGLIALLFPRARIIHCVRDPLDTCVSCYATQFNDRHGYNADLITLGRYTLAYRRLMAHWGEALPGRLHEVRYERLVAEPEPVLRALIDHLGLPWDSAMLAFSATARPVRTPSQWQVRTPLYGASVGRWRNYAEDLKPLRALLAPLP